MIRASPYYYFSATLRPNYMVNFMAFHTENVDWLRGKNRLKALREKVFVLEWRLPEEAEFDEHDEQAFHVIITDDVEGPIATGRLTKDGEIGRIAVKPSFRNERVYRKLFRALIQIAKVQSVSTISVCCELNSVPYHEQLGFSPEGHAYMDAGIPRQRMACPLSNFKVPDVAQLH